MVKLRLDEWAEKGAHLPKLLQQIHSKRDGLYWSRSGQYDRTKTQRVDLVKIGLLPPKWAHSHGYI